MPRKKPIDIPKRRQQAKAEDKQSAASDLHFIAEGLRPLAVPIGELLFDPANARKHQEKDIGALAASLRVYGQCKPVVVRRDTGVVIAGNGTLQAALDLGWTHLAAVKVDMDAATAAGYSISDNRTAELSSWDKDALDKLLREVSTDNDERLEQMLSELAEEMKIVPANGAGTARNPDGEEEPPPLDKAEELQKKWNTALGQVWQVGRHRIVCGDSSTISSETFDGVCTDPPFEMRADDVRQIIARFAAAAAVLCSDKLSATLCDEEWGHHLGLIWTHATPWSVGSENMPVFFHGHIVFMTRSNRKLGWKRPRPDFGSVIDSNYERMDGHGHGKAAFLFEQILLGLPWKTVCDPFAGSLPVLLACEQLGKTLFGCEIDPRLLAVGLERCEKSGKFSPQLLDRE